MIINIMDTDKEIKDIKQRDKIFEFVLTTVENTLKRYNSYDDPVFKYTLIVDKVCIILDIAMAGAFMYTSERSDVLRSRCESLVNKLQKDLNDLAMWIKNPHYSPDHSFGKAMMQSSHKDWKKGEPNNSQIETSGMQ